MNYRKLRARFMALAMTGILAFPAPVMATEEPVSESVMETAAETAEVAETSGAETGAPEVSMPDTEAPEIGEPETSPAETNPPETEAVETNAPETEAPETNLPETSQPETSPAETEAPETSSVETEEPETSPAETENPETEEATEASTEKTTEKTSGKDKETEKVTEKTTEAESETETEGETETETEAKKIDREAILRDYTKSRPFSELQNRAKYSEAAPIAGLPSFITEEMIIGALKAQDKEDFPASVTIAQIVAESGYGAYGPGGEVGQGLSWLAYGYCNLFGIKGSGTAGSVSMATQEMGDDGSLYTTSAGFRAYHSYTECIEDRTELLKAGYRDLTEGVTDANTFAVRVGSRWATDAYYGKRLISIMQQYDLYRLDDLTLRGERKLPDGEKLADGIKLSGEMEDSSEVVLLAGTNE